MTDVELITRMPGAVKHRGRVVGDASDDRALVQWDDGLRSTVRRQFLRPITREESIMTTQQTVRVYSKPACVQCRTTEKWLTERKVPFIHDSAEDDGVIAAARELGISAAPIVVVQTPDPTIPGGFTDEVFGGFRPDLLAQHINTEEFAA